MQANRGNGKGTGKSVRGFAVFRPRTKTGDALTASIRPAAHPPQLRSISEPNRCGPAAARRSPPNLAEMQDMQEDLQKFRDVVYFPMQNVNDNGQEMQDTMQKCKTPPHFTNLRGAFFWRRAIALLPPSMFHLGSHPRYHRLVNLFSTIIYFTSRQPKTIEVSGRRFSYAQGGRGRTFQTRDEISKARKRKGQKIKFARLPYGNEADTLRVYGREWLVMVQQRSKAESAAR